jgi:GntR family transcriptional regulator, transcriptional repressor for pyruvate dehydrogenase complex
VASNTDLGIATVLVPKASAVLADRLRELILSKGAPEGAQLPTERELMAQSGLSRASVREALRVLETEGLIHTKSGRNGGSIVRRPGHEAVSRSLDLFVRSHDVRFEAVLEVREAIEPAAARLAAMHRTDADLKAIQAAQQRLEAAADNIAEFVAANLDWHLAVVKASRNEILLAFFTAMTQPIHAATEYRSLNTTEVRRRVIEVHRKVIAAIVAKDAEAAFRRMLRHVGAYAALARQLASDGSGRVGWAHEGHR